MKQKKENNSIFFAIIMFLCTLLLCITLTFKLTKPLDVKNISKNQESKTSKTTNKIINTSNNLGLQTGNISGNLMQEHGPFASSGKYIFYTKSNNGLTELYKADTGLKNKELVMSAKDIRSLNIINKYLYCIVDKESYSLVAKIDVDTSEMMYLETTKSPYITSLIFDNQFAYFTIKNDSNVYRINDDDSIKKIYSPNNFLGSSHLVGVNNGSIYCINTKGLISVNYEGESNNILTNEITSVYQKPIMTRDSIVFFEDLTQRSLAVFDLEEKNIKKIKKDNVKFYNYIDGFLFISNGEKVEYTTDYINFNKANDIKLNNSPFFLSNKHLTYFQNGEPIQNQINWILIS